MARRDSAAPASALSRNYKNRVARPLPLSSFQLLPIILNSPPPSTNHDHRPPQESIIIKRLPPIPSFSPETAYFFSGVRGAGLGWATFTSCLPEPGPPTRKTQSAISRELVQTISCTHETDKAFETLLNRPMMTHPRCPRVMPLCWSLRPVVMISPCLSDWPRLALAGVHLRSLMGPSNFFIKRLVSTETWRRIFSIT